jgi:hypothetical protein
MRQEPCAKRMPRPEPCRFCITTPKSDISSNDSDGVKGGFLQFFQFVTTFKPMQAHHITHAVFIACEI